MVAAGAEMFVKNQTVTQAREARDALAMTLYERLFGWIVFRINKSISDLANVERKPAAKV
jgi:myosin heavy subunit